MPGRTTGNSTKRLVSILLPFGAMVFVRPLFLLLSILLLGTVACRGLQLGESEAQITARHGAPAVEDHGRRLAVYFWPGWSAQAEFQEGVVHRLTYRRNTYLGDGEIQSLLQANGGVNRWRETTARGARTRLWSRDDGANAQCAADRPTGMIFHGGRELTPSEAILSESFLQFSAPEHPTAVVTAKNSALAGASEPVVLSNAASGETPAAASPSGEENPPPPASRAPLAAAPVATPPPAVVAPPPQPGAPAASTPPAESHGLLGLLVFTAVTLGAIGLIVKTARAPQASAPSPAPGGATVAGSAPLPTASSSDAADLDSLRPDQFELLVGELFRRQGYGVELSAALGAEGGIDLVLRRDGESIPVQCQHWKTAKVAAREMREFYGAMADTASPRGIFVTTGSFTREARDFAAGKAIELLDGPALERQIAAVRRPEENLFEVPSWIDDFTAGARIYDPECPFCRGAMTIRQNRSTGVAFWSCTTYPRCAGKRDPRTDLLAAPAA